MAIHVDSDEQRALLLAEQLRARAIPAKVGIIPLAALPTTDAKPRIARAFDVRVPLACEEGALAYVRHLRTLRTPFDDSDSNTDEPLTT